MIEWFTKGGPVMWPILICSIAGLAIFLERLYSLQKSKVVPTEFLNKINILVQDRKIVEAKTLCGENRSSLSQILGVGILHHGKSRDRIKEALQEVGKIEALALAKYVGALGTIAHISPLLGLLGTVTGMMRVFQVITEKGVGNAQSLAGGISEALITTIAGLIVAIPTLVAYRFLNARIKAFVTEIEEHSLRILEQISVD